MVTMTDDHICLMCGESKDPGKARFEHVRIGLDEAPEPVLCVCRDAGEIMKSIRHKMSSTVEIVNSTPGVVMDALAKMNIDSALIDTIASVPTVEVELRLNPHLSEILFIKMSKGMFESTNTTVIKERGCVMWTGPQTNVNAKVRKRSTGEATVKVTKNVTKVAPGYRLAVSHEYAFSGRIMHVQYDVEMTELRSTMKIRDRLVNVIARKYETGSKTSFAGEFEILGSLTNSIVRSVLCVAMGTIGCVKSMRNEVDEQFMNEVRSRDHVVIDVASMDRYAGKFLAKADGMKVYAFCYEFGYVICITDPALTVVTCMVTIAYKPLDEIATKPDILVLEMLMDGTMVYIDTLAVNGTVSLPANMEAYRCNITSERPMLIYRTIWDTMPTKFQLEMEPVPNDGIVLTNKFKTMRLKQPTVDLICMDGKLNAIENGIMTPLVNAHGTMETDVVYEMDVVKGQNDNEIMLVKPRQRLSKKLPNSMDVVRRAIASASTSELVDTSLLDITSMSFSMRKRVYEMARSRATSTRKVIVVFGAGRFQEWKEMKHEGFSYIAIDPEIDTTDVLKRWRGLKVRDYDFRASFSTQVVSISKTPETILVAKCTSEHFITKTMPTRVMFEIGIPAVFPFSVSYHIAIIAKLRNERVPVFGCGFVHDGIDTSVGKDPVTMKIKDKNTGRNITVAATFGKSTYVEPYMKRCMVDGLVLVKDAMPDVWERVDSSTVEIMDRAVILTS